jgi:hypothetical protein
MHGTMNVKSTLQNLLATATWRLEFVQLRLARVKQVNEHTFKSIKRLSGFYTETGTGHES